MTQHRAYSIVEFKAVDEQKRIIEGIATTPAPDRVGDIVEPMGAEFKLPVSLLWQHRSDTPVGNVISAKKTKDGITFRAQLAAITEPGSLKDDIDRAWQSLKAGLVRGVSIGFRTIEHAVMEGGGWRFLKWEWLELSLVTVPANAEATIQNIKKFDTTPPATNGNRKGSVSLTAGVSAPKTSTRLGATAMAKKTTSEQISALEAALAQKMDLINSIQEKASSEGRSKDDDEREQFDEAMAAVKNLKQEIKDLKDIETITSTKVVKTVKADNADEAAESRGNGGRTTVIGPNKPKGIAFAQVVKCLFNANNNVELAAMLAEKHYSEDKRIANYLRLTPEQKAAVPAAYTGGSGWADVIAAANVGAEFIELLRARSIVDKFGQNGIPDLRRVPFNVKVSRMTTGLTGHWVGEALPIPVSKGVFDTVTMGKTKVAALTYMSKEQLMFSHVNTDAIIRDDLANAAAARIDATFISAAAASAGVSPAGLLNGLSALNTSGAPGDADDIRADLGLLYAPFSAAQISSSDIVLVMSEALRNSLMLQRSAIGAREFPDLTRSGGSLEFYPVIASNHVGLGDVVAISAKDVLLADEGEFDVSVSDQASIETLDGSLVQTGQAGTGASLVSLWQTESVGIKITRLINWQKARSAAVAFIGNATWGGVPSV